MAQPKKKNISDIAEMVGDWLETSLWNPLGGPSPIEWEQISDCEFAVQCSDGRKFQITLQEIP